jgi:hypothetical protein
MCQSFAKVSEKSEDLDFNHLYNEFNERIIGWNINAFSQKYESIAEKLVNVKSIELYFSCQTLYLIDK